MALTFGVATTDRAVNAAPTSVVNLATLSLATWVFMTAITTKTFMAFQSATGGWRFEQLSATDVRFFSLGATGHSYTSNSAPLATGKWICLGLSSVFGTSCHIYAGDEQTPMAEVTYATSVNGVTRTADTGGELVLGNRQLHDRALVGDNAAAGIWTNVVTLAQFEAWRQRSQLLNANCRGLWYPGIDGASVIKDRSGTGNDLTITGATVSANEPAIPRLMTVPSPVAPMRAALW